MPRTAAPLASQSFPRQQARTARFTRGAPRAFHVAADGQRVWFLRSSSGTDPSSGLWVLDLGPEAPSGAERLLADPATVLAGADEDVSPGELARRERSREGGAGIVAFATDRTGTIASFALSSRLFVVDATTGAVTELPAAGPVVDPRIDPTGTRVAYVAAGALRVTEAAAGAGIDSGADSGADSTAGGDRSLIEPDGPEVTWGLADFAAAEEMGRQRGYWWSPEGDRLLVARVDESAVQKFYIADPANPARPAVTRAYPAAGTPNADVRLAVIGVNGSRVEVEWDHAAYEYLANASWTPDGAIAVVQSRDQRSLQVLDIDADTGATSVRFADSDPVWIELVGGTPGWQAGRLVWAADRDGWRRVLLDGDPVTPEGLQVRSIVAADDDGVVFSASEEPTEVHLWRLASDGTLARLTAGSGVHTGTYGGGTLVVQGSRLDAPRPAVDVVRGGQPVATIATFAETPVLRARPQILRAGARQLRTAVLLPGGASAETFPPSSLPVLLDPYGGPHAQRVLASEPSFLRSQWLADVGFAVIVADGRGTPGRGYEFERAIAGDLATPVLDDQVEALHAVAAEIPALDLNRVGILGWSFGGYLAALAVLRRPDVFHAAVAGAPVTDWRLYDTHYTERYLGHPDAHGAAYDENSLLEAAPRLARPLMLIHGLADDNVVAAHTLRLSALFTAAGRPHTVLPLSGVTHMTPQEEVAENLLLLQVEFFRTALGGPI